MQPGARFSAIAFLAIAMAFSAPRAQFNGWVTPPRDTVVQAPAPESDLDLDLDAEPDPGQERAARTALGVLELVIGIVLFPVGLGVNYSNALEKCDEDDGGILSGPIGPCSKGSGPDKDAQAAGTLMMVGGIGLAIDGIRRIATPAEGGLGRSVSDGYK